MNRITRMLTMTGLGLVAGITMGAGPAMAAPGADQGTAQSKASASTTTVEVGAPWGGDRLVGYFRNLRTCLRAGNFGEDRGYWDEFDCERVRAGFHRSRWALVVDDNDWGHGWPGNWPGNWVGQWWPGHGHGQGGWPGHGGGHQGGGWPGHGGGGGGGHHMGPR